MNIVDLQSLRVACYRRAAADSFESVLGAERCGSHLDPSPSLSRPQTGPVHQCLLSRCLNSCGTFSHRITGLRAGSNHESRSIFSVATAISAQEYSRARRVRESCASCRRCRQRQRHVAPRAWFVTTWLTGVQKIPPWGIAGVELLLSFASHFLPLFPFASQIARGEVASLPIC